MREFGWFAVVAGVPVAAFVGTGWRVTGGVWPVPIDDAYIYAQYARGFAQGRMFEWSPGDGYSRGCTSPLYPLLLAPMWLLGLRDHWLMLGAAVLNTLGFGFVLFAVHRLVSGHGGRGAAGVAVATLASTGVVAWNAASGMEAGLAFGACGGVALAFARAWRGDSEAGDVWRLAWAQCVFGLLRPESLVASALLSASLVGRAGAVPLWRRVGILGAAPLPVLAYLGLNALMTEGPLTGSMLTKSIWGDPTIPSHWGLYAEQLGRWPTWFWPYVEFAGLNVDRSSLLLAGCLVLVCVLGARPWSKSVPMYLLLGAGIVESLFLLGQRVPGGGPHMRYVMPYLPLAVASFAGLGGLACDGVCAWMLRTFAGAPRRLVWLVWGAPVLLLSLAVPWQLRHLGEHREAFGAQSRVLAAQQVAIGRHIAEANRVVPGSIRRVFTHDAGAVLYFSGVRGLDAHGLCMELRGYPIHRAQYEGTFFPFEAVERMVPDGELPEVSALFSGGWGQWPNADEALFAPVVGMEARAFLVGTDMKLFRFPREAVRSGDRLNWDESGGWIIHDRLDVADLVSEGDHGFVMDWPAERPFRGECVLIDRGRTPPLGDVGRQVLARTEFVLRIPAGRSRIVARLQGLRPGSTLYSIDGNEGGEIESGGNEGPVLVHLADCESEVARGCIVTFAPKGRGLIGLAHVYVLRPPEPMADPGDPMEESSR